MKYDFELDLDSNNSLSCIIKRLKPNTKVLEFGCANGRLTKYMKEKLNCSITIVELEESAGNVAAKYADQSFIGSSSGDIENYLWSEKLNNEKFDFIIFADVLEHLRYPKKVLETAIKHLDIAGSFLVSIPNIANNSIIANLIRDQFVYTDTGLLDNTHISFFTKNTFEKLIEEVGCHLLYETATYTNIGNNEVPITYKEIPSELKKILIERKHGDVYQYVFQFSAKDDITEYDLLEHPIQYFQSSLFFKFEDEDLTSSNVIVKNSNIHDNAFSVNIDKDKKIDLLRFDPLETSGIIRLNNITVNGIDSDINKMSHNAISKIDNLYLFVNADPYFFIEIPAMNKIQVKISYDILDFELSNTRSKEILSRMLINENTKSNEKAIEAQNCKNQVEKINNDNEKLNLQLTDISSQLADTKTQLFVANTQLAYANNKLQKIHHRLRWIWKWVDKEGSYLNSSVNYNVDNVIVTMGKIRIKGWGISSIKQDIKIQKRPTVRIRRYARNDVNKVHKLAEEYISGFEIIAFPFIPLRIKFSDGNGENMYYINATKLYIKYWKQLIMKIKKSFKNRGLLGTAKICYSKLLHKNNPFTDSYEQWFFRHRSSKEELTRQKNSCFDYHPLISIVVPTFNTPVNLLNEMILSIENQSYSNWELCIADGHSSNKDTIQLLKSLEIKDTRIKVKFLDENYMISGNTNEAIKLVTGEFVALMDHDDLIEPDALYEFIKLLNVNNKLDFIYTDEDKINEDSSHYLGPHFKPEFSIENLRNYNYITHFALIRKSVLDKVGPFDSKCDGAQDYDMFLRICDYTKNIGHVPRIEYHWRICENSTAQDISTKSYVMEAGKYALRKHLDRNNIKATVVDGLEPTLYKVNYEIAGNPKISIIICTKDHVDDLDNCIQSILTKTTYENYEIIIVENNSKLNDTFKYYKRIAMNPKIKIVYWEDEFNYSAINNFGVENSSGDYVLLLNNDTEIITSNWLEEMLMLAQREDVGVVGCKLLYPDDTVQHAGVIVGLGGVAAHSHRGFPAESVGYVGRMIVVQNISAVTGACMMIKKKKYEEVGGLSTKYKVTYNDVDFCLRIIKQGYTNIMTPFAQLYHYESKSRGMEDTPEKHKRFMEEQEMFKNDWSDILANGDPYYNQNLTLDREDFSLREN